MFGTHTLLLSPLFLIVLYQLSDYSQLSGHNPPSPDTFIISLCLISGKFVTDLMSMMDLLSSSGSSPSDSLSPSATDSPSCLFHFPVLGCIGPCLVTTNRGLPPIFSGFIGPVFASIACFRSIWILCHSVLLPKSHFSDCNSAGISHWQCESVCYQCIPSEKATR